MSFSGALNRARALQDQLEARDVPTSIEIQIGRPGTPNERWWDRRFIGTMGHHIVSSRSQGPTPGLALVKRGRSDVPGPLCNGYLGFDGRARIICMGWANHPGAGGPYSLPGGTVPRDGARPYLFGWEIEGGLSEADWPASFDVIMGKCHAATLAWLGRDEKSHIEHKTWAPTRKIDRLGYSLSEARNELKPYLTMEDDVSAEDVWNKDGIVPAPPGSSTVKTNPEWKAGYMLSRIAQEALYDIPAELKAIRQVLTAPMSRSGMTDGNLRQLVSRQEVRQLGIIKMLTAFEPLLEAAAKNEPLSAENVQIFAAAVADAIPDDIGADVVDEFTERLSTVKDPE